MRRMVAERASEGERERKTERAGGERERESGEAAGTNLGPGSASCSVVAEIVAEVSKLVLVYVIVQRGCEALFLENRLCWARTDSVLNGV